MIEEGIFGALVFVFFVIGLVYGATNKKSESKACAPKVTVTIEPAKPDKTDNKELFNEAKDMLKLYGFSVKEAKTMLAKVGPHDNVEAWVRAALEAIEV